MGAGIPETVASVEMAAETRWVCQDVGREEIPFLAAYCSNSSPSPGFGGSPSGPALSDASA